MSQARQELLNILRGIRTHGPKKLNEGICTAVANALGYNLIVDDEIDELLTETMATWPNSSSSRGFPVPGTNGLSHVNRYMWIYKTKGNMWDKSTEYGQLRWELLDHCIAQLQGQLVVARRMVEALQDGECPCCHGSWPSPDATACNGCGYQLDEE